MLVLTDPYRIKTTAAQVSVSYHVPVGVQLVVVYMSLRDFQRLRNDSQCAFALQNSSVQNGGILPFQMKPKIKGKPVKPILFPNIPEEEAVNGFNESAGEEQATGSKRNGVKKVRPTTLPLRAKYEPKDPDTGFNSLNLDETDSFPQFIGKTSVFPTPLLENKILPGQLLSICANQVVVQDDRVAKEEDTDAITYPPKREDRRLEDKLGAMRFDNFRGNALKSALIKSTSVRAIQNMFSPHSPAKRQNGRPKYQTITDPNYPVFSDDGRPISQHMYDQWDIETGVDIAQDVESLKIEGFSTEGDMAEDVGVVEKVRNGTSPSNGGDNKSANGTATVTNGCHSEAIILRNRPKDPATEAKRRSMSLPIQPINLDPSGAYTSLPITEESGSAEDGDEFLEKLVKRSRPDFTENLRSKIIASLPLDPAWSNGLSSYTPVMTPIDSSKALIRRKSSIPKVDEVDEEAEAEGATRPDELQKVELFVCGQHNMTMLIAMEENSGQREDLVQCLWETCVSRLPKIESNLQQTLNVNVDGVVDKNDMNYSFMCFDPHWDVVQQGGHWAAAEMQAVEDIHADFKENGSFTETLVR